MKTCLHAQNVWDLPLGEFYGIDCEYSSGRFNEKRYVMYLGMKKKKECNTIRNKDGQLVKIGSDRKLVRSDLLYKILDYNHFTVMGNDKGSRNQIDELIPFEYSELLGLENRLPREILNKINAVVGQSLFQTDLGRRLDIKVLNWFNNNSYRDIKNNKILKGESYLRPAHLHIDLIGKGLNFGKIEFNHWLPFSIDRDNFIKSKIGTDCFFGMIYEGNILDTHAKNQSCCDYYILMLCIIEVIKLYQYNNVCDRIRKDYGIDAELVINRYNHIMGGKTIFDRNINSIYYAFAKCRHRLEVTGRTLPGEVECNDYIPYPKGKTLNNMLYALENNSLLQKINQQMDPDHDFDYKVNFLEDGIFPKLGRIVTKCVLNLRFLLSYIYNPEIYIGLEHIDRDYIMEFYVDPYLNNCTKTEYPYGILYRYEGCKVAMLRSTGILFYDWRELIAEISIDTVYDENKHKQHFVCFTQKIGSHKSKYKVLSERGLMFALLTS